MSLRTTCHQCPRRCRDLNRCGVSFEMQIARTGLHFGEEPCISGTRGSGTVFFVGCNLGCAFCQNADISQHASSSFRSFSPSQLADTFRRLEDEGAHNINLVTASHYASGIAAAFKLYRPKIPVVYNTSGYDFSRSIQTLSEYVSVWLPDLKFYDSNLSARLARAPDYFQVAFSAVSQMRKCASTDVYDENGLMTQGVLLRHLVLPSHVADSYHILDAVASLSPPPKISLMNQYVPMGRALSMPDVARKLTSYEYKKVLDYAERLGLDGYTQERSSATTALLPRWGEYVDGR